MITTYSYKIRHLSLLPVKLKTVISRKKTHINMNISMGRSAHMIMIIAIITLIPRKKNISILMGMIMDMVTVTGTVMATVMVTVMMDIIMRI
jgi:hypothetical protein